jgi:hypothetical protein
VVDRDLAAMASLPLIGVNACMTPCRLSMRRACYTIVAVRASTVSFDCMAANCSAEAASHSFTAFFALVAPCSYRSYALGSEDTGEGASGMVS